MTLEHLWKNEYFMGGVFTVILVGVVGSLRFNMDNFDINNPVLVRWYIISILTIYALVITYIAIKNKIFKNPDTLRNSYNNICPICGSTNLKSAYIMSPVDLARPGAKKLKQRFPTHPVTTLLFGWQPQNPDVFVCLDCDYYGICPEVDVDKTEYFRKRLKKQKK
jgi:hypothetical protein